MLPAKKTELSSKRHKGSFLFHSAVFSISVAFLLVNIAFLYTHALSTFFSRLETRINRLLGITQTDYIRGYFAVAIPTLALALIICSIFLVPSLSKASRNL